MILLYVSMNRSFREEGESMHSTTIDRYRLIVEFDGEAGFISAQIRIFFCGQSGYGEIDYQAMQTILNNEGGLLLMRTNEQNKKIKVVKDDELYEMLIKMQSDILEELKSHMMEPY